MLRPYLRSSPYVILLVILIIFSVIYLFQSSSQPPSPPRSGLSAARFNGDGNGGDENSQIVIYNRIPKTASTTFMHVPYELCAVNRFHVLLLNISRPQHFLTFADEVKFAKNITGWREKLPAIYHGHFAYIDFDRLGVNKKPIYINLIRAPLERLVSYYYFLRYGDDYRVNKIRSRMGDKMTFDECVSRKMPDCDPKKLWLQVPWFCGSFKKCWEPGSKWALEQAKHNLVHKYFLVGLTDELEAFIRLLEIGLPRFFAGASEFFAGSGASRHIRKTKYKEQPSQETLRVMRESKVWKVEHEFYEFAAAHFQWLKREMTDKSFFHYEKIRPRP